MEIKVCKNLFSKTKGLMFSKKKNLLFTFSNEKPRVIHMFFVFFPINIYYFNKNKKLTDKVKAYPFTILKPRNAQYILETIEPANLDDIHAFLKSLP